MNRSIQQRWERARSYLAQGQLAPARAQLDALRGVAPNDARTHLLAAHIAWLEDHPRDAATAALAAARAAPAIPDPACDVVDALLQTGETAAARALLEDPAWQQVAPGDALLRCADFRHRLGQHAQALAAFERLMPTHPRDAALAWYRGQQLEFLGRLEEAAGAYETCLALDPAHGQAAGQWVRLGLPASREHQLEVIDAGLRKARSGSREQADLGFARYHVLEALGHDDAAWDALAQANAVAFAQVAADVARQQETVARFIAQVPSRLPPAAAAQPAGPCPIFIVGLPRSGTTVLERMLGNHSMVTSAGELPDFGQQLLRATNTRSYASAAFFASLPPLDGAGLGARYLAQTAWRATGAPYFIDKQPGNWMLAGLIHAALPQAKILHLVRDALDVCFSLWRARFAGSYAWSYDFATLAAHHGQYRQLMRAWHAAMPRAILDVAYADLVRDPAATLRRVFDHCGLPWEPGCDDLARNTTPVCTLSAPEVRRRVHTRALGHWRRYARGLEPLRRRLAGGG